MYYALSFKQINNLNIYIHYFSWLPLIYVCKIYHNYFRLHAKNYTALTEIIIIICFGSMVHDVERMRLPMLHSINEKFDRH